MPQQSLSNAHCYMMSRQNVRKSSWSGAKAGMDGTKVTGFGTDDCKMHYLGNIPYSVCCFSSFLCFSCGACNNKCIQGCVHGRICAQRVCKGKNSNCMTAMIQKPTAGWAVGSWGAGGAAVPGSGCTKHS